MSVPCDAAPASVGDGLIGAPFTGARLDRLTIRPQHRGALVCKRTAGVDHAAKPAAQGRAARSASRATGLLKPALCAGGGVVACRQFFYAHQSMRADMVGRRRARWTQDDSGTARQHLTDRDLRLVFGLVFRTEREDQLRDGREHREKIAARCYGVSGQTSPGRGGCAGFCREGVARHGAIGLGLLDGIRQAQNKGCPV